MTLHDLREKDSTAQPKAFVLPRTPRHSTPPSTRDGRTWSEPGFVRHKWPSCRKRVPRRSKSNVPPATQGSRGSRPNACERGKGDGNL